MDGGKGCVFDISTTSKPLPPPPSPATRLPPRDAPWGHDTPCGREFNFTISQHKIHEDPTWDPDVCCWARNPPPPSPTHTQSPTPPEWFSCWISTRFGTEQLDLRQTVDSCREGEREVLFFCFFYFQMYAIRLTDAAFTVFFGAVNVSRIN